MGSHSIMFFNETQRHEDTKIKTKIYEKIKDPPLPSLFREGANIAET